MNILTLFTSLLTLSILLSACSAPEVRPDSSLRKIDETEINQTSESDIQKYREAINYISTGELEKAYTILLDFSEQHPQLAGPWANLALISIKQNKIPEAESLLNKALQRNPKMPQAHNLMGFIEKQKGNIIKAKEHYEQAVEYKDDYAIAHYNLALLYDIYIQDIAKAIVHYQKYMTLTNNKDKKTATWLEELKSTIKKG